MVNSVRESFYARRLITLSPTGGSYQCIDGRADWALGYCANRSDTGAILLVVEAKPHRSPAVGEPQLLAYVAAVHKARQKRVNRSVFGMLRGPSQNAGNFRSRCETKQTWQATFEGFDGHEFTESILDEAVKFFTTGNYGVLGKYPTSSRPTKPGK